MGKDLQRGEQTEGRQSADRGGWVKCRDSRAANAAGAKWRGWERREGDKAWHSQEEGQPCFLPAFFLLIPGSLCLGKKRPPRFLVFPLLCQPDTSLPGLLGTHVAPEAELGNEDSGRST